MRLVLGPVRSEAVTAWVENALLGISLAEQGGEGFPFRAPPESLAPAFGYLDDWLAIAKRDDTFAWSGDVDDHLALQLVRYWHNIARAMLDLAQRGDVQQLDPVAESFSDPLLRALLDGLVGCGLLGQAIAERMWTDWPRLKSPPVSTDSRGR